MSEQEHSPQVDIPALQALSRQIRGKVVEMSHKAKAPHLGSSLSCIDFLVALYWRFLKIDPRAPRAGDRDRFILSKGHAAPALYATLALRGFFPLPVLETFAQPESPLEEHPSPTGIPGVEAATGSLGHGLSIAVGMAISARLRKQDFRVVSILSDGECNEGSTWEAAMFASGQKLANVLALVDFNKWQATGRSCEVMKLQPLRDKWEAFGWQAIEIDGHDYEAILQAFTLFPDQSSRPTVIIGNTIKGKGVSFMEDDNNWHYRIPNADEVAQARQELHLS